MTELNIVPECYVDTKIAKIISQAKRRYNHQHGCGDVANEMQNNRLKEQVALGIVDEDKYKGPAPKYFAEFNLVIKENNLILKKHHTRKHYLILICPEVEKWLLEDAQKSGINCTDPEYNLPDKLKGFVQISKIKDIDRNEGFKKFIKTLMKAQAPSLTTLQRWITLFKIDQLDGLLKNNAL